MNNELRLIRYLYGEEERPEDVERLLAADGALRAEYRQLKATKEHLDAHPRQRPDAAVVDRIVAAAAQSASDHERPRPRADRAPVARTRSSRRRVLGVTSILAAVLVVVGVWQWDGSIPGTVGTEATVDASSATEEASLPAWDEADNEVVRLHHYIETLHVRSSPDRWDSPDAGFQSASQTRSLER